MCRVFLIIESRVVVSLRLCIYLFKTSTTEVISLLLWGRVRLVLDTCVYLSQGFVTKNHSGHLSRNYSGTDRSLLSDLVSRLIAITTPIQAIILHIMSL